MTTRASQRGQFLPVFLVVVVIVVIVLIALYLMKHRSGQGTTPVVTAPVATAPVVKTHVKKPSTKPTPSTTTAPKPPADSDRYAIEGPAKSRTVVFKVLPEYPDWAQEQGIQGTVVLGFKIKEDGSVRSTVLLEQSSMSEALDSAAKDALLQWKFAEGPTTDEGSRIKFKFSMGDAK